MEIIYFIIPTLITIVTGLIYSIINALFKPWTLIMFSRYITYGYLINDCTSFIEYNYNYKKTKMSFIDNETKAILWFLSYKIHILKVDQGNIVGSPSNRKFLLDADKQIYVSTHTEDYYDKIVNLTIQLMSKKLDMLQLKSYINDIVIMYEDSKKEMKESYYYKYNSTCTNNKYIKIKFSSNKTFNNMFFRDKQKVIDALDKFINSEMKYKKEGRPYTFTIILHGPPGTGKTSVGKCIVNYLGRSAVEVPLTNKKDFFNCIYDNDILLKNKIFIMDEINRYISSINKNDNNMDSNDIVSKADILTMLDGFNEQPHRVIIMTTNNIDSIDSAIIRDGRVDLIVNMDNIEDDIIKEMLHNKYDNGVSSENKDNHYYDLIEEQHFIGTFSPSKIHFIVMNNDSCMVAIEEIKKLQS